jgi:hypothetical protein
MALKIGFSGAPEPTEGIYEGPMTIGDMSKIYDFRAQNRPVLARVLASFGRTAKKARRQ